jgi:uncharacterized protein (TIGR02444 family)
VTDRLSGGEEDVPFWSFSIDLYGRPGVAPACLALQDRFGCDVNILLFALWAARCGKALASAEFDALDAAAAPWRGGVVEPIRALRRALRADAMGAAPAARERVRAKLLEAELEGEKAAQEMLARAVPLPSPADVTVDRALAEANLAAYLGWRGVDTEAAWRLAGTVLAAL